VKAVAVGVVEMGQPMILLLILLRVYNGLNDDKILSDLIYDRATEDNRVTIGQRG
jgi:hypothetical protein